MKPRGYDMKVNHFEFDEQPESGKFDRVETKKGLLDISGVSPYAETQRLDAVSRTPPEDGPLAELVTSE
jgi:hypothetical protein